MKTLLSGETAWVTGASRGIGRAIAIALARAGVNVVLAARTQEDLDQIVELLRGEGHLAHSFSVDVSSWESVAAFATSATEAAGPPSIVINNAGTGLFRDFDAMSAEDFDRQIDVTLKGPWYVTRAAIEGLKLCGRGHVVNVSSLAASHPFKRGTAYCAAKAGLDAMTECLMLELREHNIRVTTVAPGSVDTRFHRDALPAANPRAQDWMLEPERLAEAVLHVLEAPASTLISRYEVRPLRPN